MIKIWHKTGNMYYPGEISDQFDKIPPGIYRWGLDKFENPLLYHTAEAFTFNHKIYGMEKVFIERVRKTYKETTGNMGILLNGTKGTGKTITSKLIANDLGLPVILVTEKNEKLIPFLNDLQQEVIIFIDEYEKYYSNYDNTLLTILDGVLTTEYRKFFLLTTNEIHINQYLLQRPGRLRYIKTFSDLTLETVNEVLDDLLKHKARKDQCIKFISELSIITIDLVKAVIEEVNIHNEDPALFKNIFNVTSSDDSTYNLFKIEDGKEKLFIEYAYFNIQPDKFTEGSHFRVNNDDFGTIKAILPNNDIVVYKNTYDDATGDINGQEKEVYRIKSPINTHRIFRSNEIAF